MIDAEWAKVRDRWKKKVPNGDLKCDENMIPHSLDYHTGEPWVWVSRQYLEWMQSITNDPEFQKSVVLAFGGKDKHD